MRLNFSTVRAVSRPVVRAGGASLRQRLYSTARPDGVVRMAYNLHHPPDGGDAKREPILFMHGLFGSKTNNRGMMLSVSVRTDGDLSIRRLLAKELKRPVYTLDLRNHGDSAHAVPHTYPAMAKDVEYFIQEHKLENPTLVGHSMGAKVAMSVALRSPTLIQDIVAVDNAPISAQLGGQFGRYVQAMNRIESTPIASTKEADGILAEYEPTVEIRQFLFTNLLKPTPKNDKYHWRVPIKILGDSLDQMADFPFTPGDGKTAFTRPALFVRGSRSKYVADETIPLIGEFFPRFQLRDVDAGHWVISENPEGFKNAVVEFFKREKEDS
ncbi:hypothetical protein Dda_0904 [Drechslerella dactyloides]|uniref:AB hydrolase-1 domain-containing protein n=1 Tax=Drechslerella dactyloides TaxID=74499 RepID=A0AAD6J579_DREDA|nr:hypothetical protein Dda_0904 [Drechslerella dactyloides]